MLASRHLSPSPLSAHHAPPARFKTSDARSLFFTKPKASQTPWQPFIPCSRFFIEWRQASRVELSAVYHGLMRNVYSLQQLLTDVGVLFSKTSYVTNVEHFWQFIVFYTTNWYYVYVYIYQELLYFLSVCVFRKIYHLPVLLTYWRSQNNNNVIFCCSVLTFALASKNSATADS